MSGVEQHDEERWMRILRDQCDLTSITNVAEKVGYGRSAISLALSGKYPGGTAKIAAKVIATFTDCVQCPYLDLDITQATCADHQSRAMPTSDPAALRHWMTCRTKCPFSYHSVEDDKGHA
jgi:hypothetical protein